jgi:hypothetical protein
MTVEEYQKITKSAYSKYKAKKTTVDGITFDSKKEAKRWSELSLLEQVGEIKDLRRQVKYVLIPSQKDENGKVIERECSYIADFVYFDLKANKTIIEDVKGYRDPSSSGYAKFVIKRKLMLYIHNIRVKEV